MTNTAAGPRLCRRVPVAIALAMASLLALPYAGHAQGPSTVSKPVPQEHRRLLVISMDGMRPDVLLRAEAPAIRGLMRQGAFTFYAQSTDLAVTLPTHISMLTGLQPKEHGITANNAPAKDARKLLTKPTLFELAKAAGRTTAMAAAKSKCVVLDKPGTLDWSYYPTEVSVCDDATVGREALSILSQHSPQVMFVHFAGPDTIGHRDGWGSESQLKVVAEVDGLIGKLVAELDRQGIRDKTLILITTDHGGAAKGHGGLDPRSRHIPFIASGPGVRGNYDLTMEAGLEVHVEDTFATGLDWLGIDCPKGIYGKAVGGIYEQQQPATQPSSVPAGMT